MKPLPAVGLASSTLQLSDFAIKILSKEHKLFQPTESETPENHVVLQDIANHFYRLISELDRNDLKKLTADPKRPKLSEAAEQLLKLSDEIKELTTPLIDSVLQAQARGSFGDPKWQTGREALLSVQKKKDISALKKKLKHVSVEVNTSLLLALRQYLEQSAETGLPVFSDDDAPHVHPRERWQNQAMDMIHENSWKPKNKKNVEEFSKLVETLIQSENEARFRSDLFAKLQFPAMNDRLQSVPEPFEGSYEWLLKSPSNGCQKQKENNFLDWLASTEGQNLYWITGKPGSGKSILMKYLLRNEQLFPSLEAWSGSSPGIIAGFFFWSSGTELHNSGCGLLRTLLYEALQDMIYGPLQKDPGVIQWLFADRSEQSLSYGGGMHDFTFADLRRAFELMMSDVSKKFFFLIDGLDEIEDFPTEVVELLRSSTKRDNVKICTSSRNSPAYQDAFENRPHVVLDDRMNNDIRAYTAHLFDEEERFAHIRNQESPDQTVESIVVGGLVKKACGVFLWATLSAEFLLQSISEADDLSTLYFHVEALPMDMEGLLTHIFQSLDRVDLEQAARLFRLVNAHGYPTLLGLSFANDLDTASGVKAEVRPLNESETSARLEQIVELVTVQCRNFLTVFEAGVDPTTESSDEEDLDQGKSARLRINYTHRAIRDFVQSARIGEQIRNATGNNKFNSDENWANASLWNLKTLHHDGDSKLPLWNHIAWCIEYALRLEEKDGKVRLTYLDEVGRAGITERKDLINLAAIDLPDGVTTESFLDLAVWLNLGGYVRIKAKDTDRKEIKHSLEYEKVVRKRLGRGGEDRWVGEQKKLKAAYASTTPELYQLLEYYAKAVAMRFATPKPHLDIPEHV
ncbi:hypothetical protein P154DRAFT_622732 [Amniculicola lignicola CBS 123094]|uniref:NACHT domain-containing protein n=1 Tax=Amniculicola lignicola CBS 123094 TaxID=1392246 RepID=A0A6A5W8F0_9PLEO|nr:hypothetical protein P154DRAFT_622732 [Amniculicola lignicola CBS 123094]